MAHTLPDAETIRRTADEVIARPEYRLDERAEQSSLGYDIFLKVLEWIFEPFRWLYNAMEGVPIFLRYVIIVVLVVVLIALLVHMFYSLIAAVRPVTAKGGDIDVDDQAPDPDSLEQLAGESAEQHDYISAIRLLFRACLIRLEQQSQRKFRPGTTNREYLRRFRNSVFGDSLQLFVDTIDRKWYGDEECQSGDYESCREAYEFVRRRIDDLHGKTGNLAHAHST